MTVLIYGGSGALGRQLVNAFNAKGHVTVSVDLFRNDAAGINIIMSKELDTMTLQAAWIKQQLVANGVEQLDALICVAGGWAGGNAAAADTLHNAELMIKQSVYSSFVAAHVAAEYVKEGGFVLLTGALAAAQGGTAYMIGYGAAKAAVHQLTKSLAAPSSGLKEGVRVAAILPYAIIDGVMFV
jgi:dihydropteridine reductase